VKSFQQLQWKLKRLNYSPDARLKALPMYIRIAGMWSLTLQSWSIFVQNYMAYSALVVNLEESSWK
jgi:hypothetical protein